jgi:hypothetical protein
MANFFPRTEQSNVYPDNYSFSVVETEDFFNRDDIKSVNPIRKKSALKKKIKRRGSFSVLKNDPFGRLSFSAHKKNPDTFKFDKENSTNKLIKSTIGKNPQPSPEKLVNTDQSQISDIEVQEILLVQTGPIEYENAQSDDSQCCDDTYQARFTYNQNADPKELAKLLPSDLEKFTVNEHLMGEWVYFKNREFRKYQFSITESCLF